MEIKDYAEIFRRALKEVGSEQAAIMIVQEIGKDIRQSQIPDNKRQKPADMPSEPATERQLKTLDKFNIPYPKDITKQEAIKLISESMDTKRNQENPEGFSGHGKPKGFL